jgi:hypothetical protein
MRSERQIEEMNDGKMESVQIVEGQVDVNGSVIKAQDPHPTNGSGCNPVDVDRGHRTRFARS